MAEEKRKITEVKKDQNIEGIRDDKIEGDIDFKMGERSNVDLKKERSSQIDTSKNDNSKYKKLAEGSEIRMQIADEENEMIPPMGVRRLSKIPSEKTTKAGKKIMVELPGGKRKPKVNGLKLGVIPRKRTTKKKPKEQKGEEEQMQQQGIPILPSQGRVIRKSRSKKKRGKAGWIGALVGGGAAAGTIGTASAKVPIVIISVINFLS